MKRREVVLEEQSRFENNGKLVLFVRMGFVSNNETWMIRLCIISKRDWVTWEGQIE
jgi:hypothetical protein